jgi:hypothetical protein
MHSGVRRARRRETVWTGEAPQGSPLIRDSKVLVELTQALVTLKDINPQSSQNGWVSFLTHFKRDAASRL